MAKQTNKTVSPVTHAIAIEDGLVNIAAEVAGAMHEMQTLSQTLGDLTREAAALIGTDGDLVVPFVATCKALVEASGVASDSVKVYLSNMRGVLNAMVKGYEPRADATLRTMYMEIPAEMKKATGKRGATLPGAGKGAAAAQDGAGDDEMDDGGVAKGPALRTVTPAEARKLAVTQLFGHHDDELQAAVDWAAKNEGAFIRYVKASIEAKRRADAEAASKQGSGVLVELEAIAA